VEIHDKHIELIVRQMLRRVRVVSANDSDFLPSELIDDLTFKEINKGLVQEGSSRPRAVPS
jgi:DNA-directed RNA polymerase subunit beta'